MTEYFWYYGASDSRRAIFSLLERTDGVSLLDLGCSDGSSTMLVAEITRASKVYGIDLDEENVMRARTGIGSTAVGWVKKFAKSKLVRLKVEAETLDNIVLNKIPSLDHVKLLKVDVEGAEVEALKGATKILKLKDYIIFESSKQTIESCLGILSGFDEKFI
jgi:SAM-dependent methyltransferase